MVKFYSINSGVRVDNVARFVRMEQTDRQTHKPKALSLQQERPGSQLMNLHHESMDSHKHWLIITSMCEPGDFLYSRSQTFLHCLHLAEERTKNMLLKTMQSINVTQNENTTDFKLKLNQIKWTVLLWLKSNELCQYLYKYNVLIIKIGLQIGYKGRFFGS